MSVYPGTLDSFTTKADGGAILAGHVNDLQSAVVATQTELGTNPSGASATVAARFTSVDSTVAAKLSAASNLSDLTDAAAARSNLGLGNSATRAVGTSAGTVAAGDDSRLTQAGAAYSATALFLASFYK